MLQNRKGFTLIELLVVIGIVGILLSITIVAINPARQFRLANDVSRAAAINTISSAVSQMIIDNKGSVPTTMSLLQGQNYISMYASNTTASNALKSLCQIATGIYSVPAQASAQTYIPKLPIDPAAGYVFTSCTDFDLGYSIKISNGRVYVTSRSEEPAGTIEAAR